MHNNRSFKINYVQNIIGAGPGDKYIPPGRYRPRCKTTLLLETKEPPGLFLFLLAALFTFISAFLRVGFFALIRLVRVFLRFRLWFVLKENLVRKAKLTELLLDLGETVAGENLMEMAITGEKPYVFAFQRDCKNAAQIVEIEPRIKSGKDFCRYFMEKAGTADEKTISAAASTVLDRIASLNLQNMSGCFRGLKEGYRDSSETA